MKNVSLAINAVLLVLIVVLFFMFSSLKKSIGGDSGNTSSVPMTITPGKQRIVV